MKVSLQWLSKYVDTSKISVKKIAAGLTEAGLEVENILTTKTVKNLLVGYIKTAEKHPDAKKLTICTVTDGTKDYQVICGAPNAEAGQYVVLACPGAVLPDGLEIKKTAIRGVNSEGMLCSERELGLSDSHDGIIVLGADCKPGDDANGVIGLGDTFFDIGITPNRGDCLSIYGVARDFSAIFKRPLLFEPFAVDDDTEIRTDSMLRLRIEGLDGCPYYAARVIKDVKQGPSPQWMQKRLKSAGIRPISNVVDVTNYVMLEYGQPLHAFDLKEVDRGIVVRYAKKGEKITTLDGKERVLDEKMLVIADESKVIGLAGVMGGEYSGIHSDTTDVVLECAYFTPSVISYTAKKLGINSDSSYRYARGVDYGRTRALIDYSANMISHVCGGQVLHGALTFGEPPASVHVVTAYKSKICALIGKQLSADTIIDTLRWLGISTIKSGDKLTISVPSHRPDVNHSAAIAEEVARLYGISKLPVKVPKFPSDAAPLSSFERYKRRLRYLLADMGFNESINYSFMQRRYLELFDDGKDMVDLLNPLSEEMNTLRRSAFPGLIKTLEYNWNQGERSIRMFEFAAVFKKGSEKDKQPEERTKAAMGVMGDFVPLSWSSDGRADTFYHMKSVCDNLLSCMNLNAEYRLSGEAYLHPGKSADMFVNGKKIGYLGALHPDIEEKLDLKSSVYIAEFDFDLLVEMAEKRKLEYKSFSKFPSIYKDISVVVPKNTTASVMMGIIGDVSQFITDIVLYDVYTGAGIAETDKSVTFRICFAAMDRTLTDDEINPVLMKMADALGEKLGAKLR